MKTYRLKIQVRYKDGILDPQAEAIESALKTLKFNETKKVFCEKAFVIDYEAEDEKKALAAGKAMGDQILSNPVMEDFEVEVLA